MTVSSTTTIPGIGTPSLTKRERNDFFQDMEDDLFYSAFDTEEFSDEDCPYYFKSVNKTVPINGTFDDEFYGAETSAQVEMESSTPVFICQTSNFIHPVNKEDILTIRGKRYIVKQHQPDGTGVSVLILHYE